MKSLLPFLLLPLLTLAARAEEAACACCVVAATETKTADVHPLKGVIVKVMPERSALLVKHEEIPGVMKAMTMLLKVDADTLKTAQADQAITGELVKKDDGWWLLNVKPATD